MKSPIVVLVIYQFMSCWNEFNLALIMLTKNQIKTLPLGLVNFWTAYQAQWGQVGAAMIMASVPVLVIYLFFSNQITDVNVHQWYEKLKRERENEKEKIFLYCSAAADGVPYAVCRIYPYCDQHSWLSISKTGDG